MPGPGGCLVPGVSAQGGGVPGPGGSAPGGGGGILACLRQTPSCEQNDRQVQKYYLAPNFVCGR